MLYYDSIHIVKKCLFSKIKKIRLEHRLWDPIEHFHPNLRRNWIYIWKWRKTKNERRTLSYQAVVLGSDSAKNATLSDLFSESSSSSAFGVRIAPSPPFAIRAVVVIVCGVHFAHSWTDAEIEVIEEGRYYSCAENSETVSKLKHNVNWKVWVQK